MTEHRHEYRMYSHIDGCHFFHTTYLCICGDVQAKGHERDFHDEDDVYSRMFAVDECPRCQELLKGAKPKELV